MILIKSLLIEKFWSRVLLDDDDKCWNWIGIKSHNGYGTLSISHGITMRAHRLSWIIRYGEIPDGLLVLHKCDNPPCVNPTHLFLGTYKDNAMDAKTKGRWTRGEMIGKSKLSIDQVKEIRERYRNKEKYLRHNASAEFGVSESAIKAIIYNHNWKWSNEN